MGLSSYNGFTGKEREASLRRVHKLWESGEVPRPTKCALACGQTVGVIHGHSEDYSDDTVHIEICIMCHLMLHMRFQMPQVWNDYRLAVRNGFRYQGKPLEQRNGLYVLKNLLPEVLYQDEHYVGEVTSGTVLDMICPIKFIHPNATKPEESECLTKPSTVIARTPAIPPDYRTQPRPAVDRGPNPFSRPRTS